MTCAEYSEKEIAIFNGLIDLIRKGANPYTIKVSDIAKSANIGKGTIYDYFDSKEEAISKALIYSINNEIETASIRINSKESFKDMFYEVLNLIMESMGNNLSTINILMSSGGVYEFYEHLLEEKLNLLDCLRVVDSLVNNLLEKGYKEGIINTEENKFYQIMAVRGAIASFSGYLGTKELFPEVTMNTAMDSAYKMLIKVLN